MLMAKKLSPEAKGLLSIGAGAAFGFLLAPAVRLRPMTATLLGAGLGFVAGPVVNAMAEKDRKGLKSF